MTGQGGCKGVVGFKPLRARRVRRPQRGHDDRNQARYARLGVGRLNDDGARSTRRDRRPIPNPRRRLRPPHAAQRAAWARPSGCFVSAGLRRCRATPLLQPLEHSPARRHHRLSTAKTRRGSTRAGSIPISANARCSSSLREGRPRRGGGFSGFKGGFFAINRRVQIPLRHRHLAVLPSW